MKELERQTGTTKLRQERAAKKFAMCVQRMERLPVSWIVEQCAQRWKAAQLPSIMGPGIQNCDPTCRAETSTA